MYIYSSKKHEYTKSYEKNAIRIIDFLLGTYYMFLNKFGIILNATHDPTFVIFCLQKL